jgi:hypothetical protein
MHNNMEGDTLSTARTYRSVHESGQCAPFAILSSSYSSLVAQLYSDHCDGPVNRGPVMHQ